MAPIRIGIIGAGGIAAVMHLPELAKLHSRAKVTLISGRRESRLQTLAERHGVPRWTTNFDDVIADDDIDAVIVATPHAHHVPWAARAVQAGKHVLVEKPLCADMGHADQFVSTVEAGDRTAMVLPHYAPIVCTMRRLIREGAIGKVSGVRARTSHGGPEVYYNEVADVLGEPRAAGDALWFFDAKQASVGALFDMGVYAVAHVVALLGSVRQVSAMTATVDKPTTLEDTATLIMRTESGALATAETGWCDPGRTWRFSAHGTEGKLVADGFTLNKPALTGYRPSSLDSDHAEVLVDRVTPDCGRGGVHEHWFDCIERGEQPPVSNAQTARHVTEVLLAGLEAARSGRAIDVNSSAQVD